MLVEGAAAVGRPAAAGQLRGTLLNLEAVVECQLLHMHNMHICSMPHQAPAFMGECLQLDSRGSWRLASLCSARQTSRERHTDAAVGRCRTWPMAMSWRAKNRRRPRPSTSSTLMYRLGAQQWFCILNGACTVRTLSPCCRSCRETDATRLRCNRAASVCHVVVLCCMHAGVKQV